MSRQISTNRQENDAYEFLLGIYWQTIDEDAS
jgi:hypothetical protein